MTEKDEEQYPNLDCCRAKAYLCLICRINEKHEEPSHSIRRCHRWVNLYRRVEDHR